MLDRKLWMPSLKALLVLATGTIGGVLFAMIGTPLPWTLGPLFVTAVFAVVLGQWGLPRFAASIARPLVGVMAGSAFTMSVLMAIPGWWNVILALVVYSVAMMLLGRAFFARLCGYDNVTAFFASAPGGLGELTLLGGALGGDMRRLALIHAVRITVVVLAMPFLVMWFLPPGGDPGATALSQGAPPLSVRDWAVLTGCAVIGFVLGRPLKALGGVMLIPMVLSAAAHIAGLTDAAPPGWLTASAQVLIGCIAGSRFAGTTWRELRTTIVQAHVWAAVLLACAIAAACLCSVFIDQPLLALILAFSPGGIVEVTILAYAVGFNVAFVVTMQLCRVILVLMITPAVYRATRGNIGSTDGGERRVV